MKTGISCTTYARPMHIAHWTKSVAEFSPEDAIFHIANDAVDRRGVAYRKTECIRELYNAGCQYFFITDDDCFPVKKGWTDFFIDAHKASGQHHFCYLHETPGVKKLAKHGSIIQYDNCNGCMMFFTREVVEKVGGFNPNFFYGFEHANFTNRVYQAKLNTIGAYLCPEGAEDYIYSLDIDNHKPELHKRLKHKSSLSPREAFAHACNAYKEFQESTTIYFPL